MTDRFKEAKKWLDDIKERYDYRTVREQYIVIMEALNFATESEQLRDAYTSMGVTLAARNSEIEQLRKRLAELETLIEQANNKIKWYEKTEATND